MSDTQTKLQYNYNAITSLFTSPNNFRPIVEQYNQSLFNPRSNDFIDKVVNINEILYKNENLPICKIHTLSHKQFNIINLKFSNLFCYGEDNVINFNNYPNIMDIMSLRVDGKTVLRNIISFAIWGKCDDLKVFEMINNNKNNRKMETEIIVESEGDIYKIERQNVITLSNISVKDNSTCGVPKVFTIGILSKRNIDFTFTKISQPENFKQLINTLFGTEGNFRKINVLQFDDMREIFRIGRGEQIDYFTNLFNLHIFSNLKKIADIAVSSKVINNDEYYNYYDTMLSFENLPKLLLTDALNKSQMIMNKILSDFEEPNFYFQIKDESIRISDEIDIGISNKGNYDKLMFSFCFKMAVREFLNIGMSNIFFMGDVICHLDENNRKKLIKIFNYVKNHVGVCMVVDNSRMITEYRNITKPLIISIDKNKMSHIFNKTMDNVDADL